jgi:peptide/nickel transport system ATP-binding protein
MIGTLLDVDGGRIRFDGADVTMMTPAEIAGYRRQIQMIFQDPFSSLNPRMKVESIVAEPLLHHKILPPDQISGRVQELLDRVGLTRAAAAKYPHEFSGGQRQRISIARALATQPRFLICDEPTSALDVSIQAQILNILKDLQEHLGLTMLFISHDLSIVRYLSDRVLVMYLGHVVEMGTTEQVFQPPYHPYTEALLSAVPIADTSIEKKHIVLEGDIPSAMNPPSGCPFQTRCGWKSEVLGGLCETEVPSIRKLAGGHQIKCHLADDILAKMDAVIKIAAE